jgi:DNA polymerase (family 10)
MPDLDNVAIASRLELMADLLEISGADTYRFLSYRKAGGTIRTWPEQLSVMAEDDRLTEVPGVGAKLAGRIESLIGSGSFTELDEITERYPETLAAVMQVQGVGPKRAALLYEKRGIASVHDLDAALDRGELDGVAGLGAKTIGRIRGGVSAYLRHHERVLLMDALPVAEQFAERIRALDSASEVVVAGSVRRAEETVASLDIVAVTGDPIELAEDVRRLSGIAELLDGPPDEVHFLSTAGLAVSVHSASPASFGTVLVRATGSEAHLARLGELPVTDSEAALYSALEMACPPPEIREDTGEVEAALADELPVLISRADVRGDLHAHTTATDAHSTLEENRAVAAELGYEYLGVTDHAYDLRMVGGLDTDALEAQWTLVDELNADTSGPRILKGIELNIGAGGRVDYPESVLERFDYCIASLHDGWSEPPEIITERLVEAMANPYVDIIGHPTGRIIGRRDPLALEMTAVLEAAAGTGTVLELNSYPDRLDLSAEHLRQAREMGVRFAMDTDAHRAEQLRYISYGVATARRGWVEPSDVINTLPVDEMLDSLKRSRASR